jgi:hypothetical protein
MTLENSKRDDTWYQSIAAFISEAPPEVRGLMGRLMASALVVFGCLFILADGGWRVELGYTFAALGAVFMVELVLWTPRIKYPKMPIRIRPLGVETSSSQEWQEEQRREEEQRIVDDYNESLRRSRLELRINLIRVPIEMALLIGLAIYMGFLTPGSTNPFSPAKGKLDKYVQEQRRTQAELRQVQEELSKNKADQAQDKEQFSKSREEQTKSLDKVTKQSDDLARRIAAMQQNGGNSRPSGPPGNGGGGAATGSDDGGIHLSWSVLLLAIVALVVLGLVAKKHKEALPVAGAAGLATEALKHGGELSKMTEAMYWHLLNYFLFVSVALLVVFVVVAVLDIWKRSTGRAGSKVEHEAPSESRKTTSVLETVWSWIKGGDKGEKKESTDSYLSSLGFSVLVLLWAAVMVGYKASTPTTPPQGPDPKRLAISAATLIPLHPTQRFVDKLARKNPEGDSQDLVKSLNAQQREEGDLLLLVGSTDCRQYKHPGGNDQLAKDRANLVKESLKGMIPAPGLEIITGSLNQAEKCAGAAEQMAVYPFLIQAKTAPQ